MKRISTIAILAFAIAACGDKIETKDDEKFDFGEVGPFLELVYSDGVYAPKSDPVGQETFDAKFKGTYRLEEIKSVSKTGKLTTVEMLPGIQYPLFAVKDGGKIRQYIDATQEKTYKDGSYSYDSATGILTFEGVVSEHPEFRVVTLKDEELTGTFKAQNNDSDESVLTLYVYSRLSPLDEAGLDQLYGAE